MLIVIPLFLHLTTMIIPEPDLSNIKNPHPFQHIDNRVFFIGIILNFGIYLYPLHIIFINKHTIQISKKLFNIVSIICMLFFPLYTIIISFPVKYYFWAILYIIVAFIFPYLFIYQIKFKLHKKGD